MDRRALLATMVGACALLPATAHAGTYDVYSCKFGSNFYGNNAWDGGDHAGGGRPHFHGPDTICPDPPICSSPSCTRDRGGSEPGLRTRVSARLRVSRRQTPGSPTTASICATLHHAGQVGLNLFVLGGTPSRSPATGLEPGGRPGRVTAEQHWRAPGLPSTRTVTLSRANSPQPQARYRPDDVAPRRLPLEGARTAEQPRPAPDAPAPRSLLRYAAAGFHGVQAGLGLLAPGVRSGDEPLAFSATDNSGIRRQRSSM